MCLERGRPVAESFARLVDGLEILLERLECLFFVRCELAAAGYDCLEVVDLFLDTVGIARSKLFIAASLELGFA